MKLASSINHFIQQHNITGKDQERFFAILQTSEVRTVDDLDYVYECFCLQEELQQLQHNFHSHISDAAVPDLATMDLLQQIQNLCPQCKQKSRSLTQIEYLACESCAAPTSRPQYHLYSCTLCQYTDTMRVSVQEMAKKEWCGRCD